MVKKMQEIQDSDLGGTSDAIATPPIGDVKNNQDSETLVNPENVGEETLDNGEISAEELRRQARAAAKSPTVKEPQNDGDKQKKGKQSKPKYKGEPDPEKTVSSELELATAQAANQVVAADEKARLRRIQSGVEAGVEDIADFVAGRRLGQLLSLAETAETDAQELGEQLKKLREHTNQTTYQIVHQALKAAGFDEKVLPSSQPVGQLNAGGEEEPDPLLLEQMKTSFLLPSNSTRKAFTIFSEE